MLRSHLKYLFSLIDAFQLHFTEPFQEKEVHKGSCRWLCCTSHQPQCPGRSECDSRWNAAQRGEQQCPWNSLLYYQHLDPQETNSTAKGFSENLQPLYALSTRSRKQIPKEKTDQDSVSCKFLPHCQWCFGLNKCICLSLAFLALLWGRPQGAWYLSNTGAWAVGRTETI